MKVLFDIFAGFILLIISLIPMLSIALIVKLTSAGPVLYWSSRIGMNNVNFKMPKFRTMKLTTPQLATHLLEDPELFFTPFGKFLRKWSLDELPQLLSVIKGYMSLVGPRPALYNQKDLKSLRIEEGIHKLKPGLTGWAQVNGRSILTARPLLINPIIWVSKF